MPSKLLCLFVSRLHLLLLADVLRPDSHIQFPLLSAQSASSNSLSKCFAPCSQLMNKSPRVRKQATLCRAKWCDTVLCVVGTSVVCTLLCNVVCTAWSTVPGTALRQLAQTVPRGVPCDIVHDAMPAVVCCVLCYVA